MPIELSKMINTDPIYYHREYKNDIGQKPETAEAESSNLLMSKLKYGAAVALPFITLYKPVSYPISIALGATRSCSCLLQLIESWKKGDSKEKIAPEMFQTTLAIVTCIGTVFASPVGIVLTTGQDLVLESVSLVQELRAGNYKKATTHCTTIINNSLYLAMAIKGGPELAIASLAIQVLRGLYCAVEDFNAGNRLQGSGHLVMTIIRSYQLLGQVKVLQMKWEQENQIAKRLETLKARLDESRRDSHIQITNKKSSIRLYSALEPSDCSAEKKTSINNYQKELVDILIKYGNNPDQIPPLHHAIQSHDLKAVKILVEHGSDVNFCYNGTLSSPMYFATKAKDLDMMNYLFQNGAKSDLISVQTAALANFVDGLDLLLTNNPPLSAQSGQLLQTSIIVKNISTEVAKCLIRHGADCKSTETYNLSAGQKELIGLLSRAIPRKDLELVKLLVNNGAPINYCLNDIYISQELYTIHLNPLYLAIQLEEYEIAKYLISQGARTSDAHQRWFESELVLRKNTFLDLKKLQMLLDLQLLDQIRIQNLFDIVIAKGNLIAVALFNAGGKIRNEHMVAAARTGNRELIEWLLNHGVRP